MRALAVVAASHCGVALATADANTARGVEDQTTGGRKLLKAALPGYPREEEGRWTESCVSLYFTVRPDGKTDQFVVLEATRPGVMKGRRSTADDRAFDTLPQHEKEQESREMWRFVEPSMKALFTWEYAAAAKPSDEVAVFRFERSEMGGRVMKISARRLDLGTASPAACAHLDPAEVRKNVAGARAGKK